MTKPDPIYSQWNKLTPEEEHIIVHKGTEYPWTGELLHEKRTGIFICRRCNTPLYNSYSKFDSGCGRPSFDDAIPGAVSQTLDADGRRTEITCSHCGGHLGHVFTGERFTDKDTRHCVNSLSMRFVPQEAIKTPGETEVIYFGGGCFWCIEAVFQQLRGVLEVRSGYMWWKRDNPSYEQVSTGVSGHVEVVQVSFDPAMIPLNILLDVFFASHDPTSMDKQGNDTGEQYRSVIFYTTEAQKEIIDAKIQMFNTDVYDNQIVTLISPAKMFWVAEWYHQNYYNQNKDAPYCQIIINPKIKKIRESFRERLQHA